MGTCVFKAIDKSSLFQLVPGKHRDFCVQPLSNYQKSLLKRTVTPCCD